MDKSVGKDLTDSKGLIDLARYFQRKAWRLQDQYAKYYTLRMDITNHGGTGCNLVERIITPKAFSVRKPDGFPNGMTIESQSERMKIVMQCEGDGELEIKWTECRSSFSVDTFIKLKRKIKKLERDLENIKNGWSFKIGRVITFIPGKIRYLLRN